MVHNSGIGVYLKNILPCICKEFEVTLLGNKWVLDQLEWTKGISVIHFDAKIYSLKEQLMYPLVIPKTTTLFWCPHFNAPLLPTRAKKLLTTIYDVNHLANKATSSYLKWRYAKTLYVNAVKKSKRVITISDFSRSELVHFTGIGKDKITRIYCGVDFDLFSEKETNTHLDLPKTYLLFVGNIKPHKNLICLLKAYGQLSESLREKYKLVILGKKDGFITPDIEIFKFIETHNMMKDIYFTGYVEDKDVPSVYRNATLFVFPSLYEGFGLPPLEAMASGVPVLCSNASSLPEVGGKAVMYFNPNDYNELCEKLVALLSDAELRRSLSEKGKKRARLFSWDNARKEHIEIINSLLI